MSSTAFTTPSSVSKEVRRFLTSSRLPSELEAIGLYLPHLRIESIPQAVAQKVQREECQRHRRAGKDQLPRKDRDVRNSVRGQRAPRSKRRLHAKAEKRKKRLRQHDLRNRQRGVDDYRTKCIRDEMAEDNSRRGDTSRARRQYKLLVLERQYLPANDPRHRQPRNRSERDEQQRQLSSRRLTAKHRQQHDHDDHVKQRIEHVDDAHHQVVNAAAHISRNRAVADADQQRHERRDDPDKQRDLPAL